MRIIIGSDHRGYDLKEYIKSFLKELNYSVADFGTNSDKPVDYPIYARKVCNAIMEETGSLGILCCYTGIGMSIAANKVIGIRASLCEDVEKAKLAREHNNPNVLALGAINYLTDGKLDPAKLSKCNDIVRTWLTTDFSNEARYKRRLEQILSIEVPNLYIEEKKREKDF
ncbi:ribose 5-phosphate isomerase B [Candidatus Woesearchaeota archaeon]|nr:ribose 5-phosphate isomerase B [Candidatus Woesearchaeota archaeon]